MSLVWREQLSVANDAIDNDHKHLIEIINLVEESMLDKNRNKLATALNTLVEYSQIHFEREEKIAEAAGYTQTPHLHDTHQALLKQLEKVQGEMDGIGQEWSDETAQHFTTFLRAWLIDHVIKEDLLMKPYLEKFSPLLDMG